VWDACDKTWHFSLLAMGALWMLLIAAVEGLGEVTDFLSVLDCCFVASSAAVTGRHIGRLNTSDATAVPNGVPNPSGGRARHDGSVRCDQGSGCTADTGQDGT
jgi:hypothetical protein